MADSFDVILGAGRSVVLQGVHSHINVGAICVLVPEPCLEFGPEAFWAVVILWVVSPSWRLRTSTAIRSVGLKLSRMYSDADGGGGMGFSRSFMAAPDGSDR